jgi:butyryl-CoA dehydrogenase
VTVVEEIRAFAESVAAAVSRTLPEPPVWHPGQIGDDRCPELTAALARIGWLSLATDPDLLAFAGPAALELGRALAPVCEIDVLLGGSPMAGDLVRYHDDSRHVVRFGVDGVSLVRVTRSQALAYGDAIGVHRVLEGIAQGRLSGHQTRTAAWIAASVGYLAGVGERALGVTVDYAKDRRVFGSTLASLTPVQQLLADVATTARGLRLLAMDCPGLDALAYSGPALCRATASCQQVVGAIGYTLEFPLQRAYRRVRALQLWTDSVLDHLAAAGA